MPGGGRGKDSQNERPSLSLALSFCSLSTAKQVPKSKATGGKNVKSERRENQDHSKLQIQEHTQNIATHICHLLGEKQEKERRLLCQSTPLIRCRVALSRGTVQARGTMQVVGYCSVYYPTTRTYLYQVS